MNHKAPRRYSHGRNFGVERQEDFAADIVTRRPYVPYDNRMRKGPNNFPRNLVWTSKDYKPSEGNRPRKNEANGSTKPPVLGTGYCVSNQPRKNAAYGPKASSISDTRGQGARDYSNPNLKKCVCSDRLFSVSSDGALRIWDCNTGQCVHAINLQADAGSLISEGPWVFLGLPNAVMAFNVLNSKDVHLGGVVGQVNAMTVTNGMLFAGTSSGKLRTLSLITGRPLRNQLVETDLRGEREAVAAEDEEEDSSNLSLSQRLMKSIARSLLSHRSLGDSSLPTVLIDSRKGEVLNHCLGTGIHNTTVLWIRTPGGGE